MNENVAQRGGLDRARQNRHTARIGRQLGQQIVLRTTSHQMDDIDLGAGEVGGLAHDAPVGDGKAVQDAAHRLRWTVG